MMVGEGNFWNGSMDESKVLAHEFLEFFTIEIYFMTFIKSQDEKFWSRNGKCDFLRNFWGSFKDKNFFF